MNATATDPSRARPQPHIGKWLRSTCPGACRKRGDRKRPQATKKMIQESCTQPAGWGRGQSQAKSPQGCAYGLLPRPARGSEATGRRQAPASFVQAFCLVHFCRRLGVPGGRATRASRVPGGTQDPEQSCSLLGPSRISNRRALGGSSCSEGLCLSSDGLWPPSPGVEGLTRGPFPKRGLLVSH